MRRSNHGSLHRAAAPCPSVTRRSRSSTTDTATGRGTLRLRQNFYQVRPAHRTARQDDHGTYASLCKQDWIPSLKGRSRLRLGPFSFEWSRRDSNPRPIQATGSRGVTSVSVFRVSEDLGATRVALHQRPETDSDRPATTHNASCPHGLGFARRRSSPWRPGYLRSHERRGRANTAGAERIETHDVVVSSLVGAVVLRPPPRRARPHCCHLLVDTDRPLGCGVPWGFIRRVYTLRRMNCSPSPTLS